VHIGESAYWDGLFSQNPPVRELLDVQPDEVWVVQINPSRTDRLPRSVLDIADRRNELSGNLSLYQELHTIEKIDRLLAEGLLDSGGRYRQITVRVIELARSRVTRLLGPASKLNRDPRFISELVAQGRRQAGEFLTALRFETSWRERDVDAALGLIADDAELEVAGVFPPMEGVRGGVAHDAVRDLLSRGLHLDLTRKQLAEEEVIWTVRSADGGPGELGQVAAEFRDGKVRRLVVGPPSR
jgi:NTE family protein